MTRNKMLSTTLSCVLSLTVLTACSSTPSASTPADTSADPQPHTHVASQQWDRDLKQHWHVCECGEKLDVQEHTLIDNSLCEVCGSEIWEFGDGNYDIYNYNEYGDTIRVSYYENEVLTIENRYDITYDADGNMLSQKHYQNDMLMGEEEYALHPDGWSQLVRLVMYQEDGSKYVNEYDIEGNLITAIGYDANGSITSEIQTEYAETEDGEVYQSKETTVNEEGTLICEYNKYGDILSRIRYVNGELEYEERYEREYNEDGRQIWEKTYRNGLLIREITGYAEVETDDYWMRYPETVIDYYDDGTKQVTYRGGNGEVETETFYAADGTVNRVLSYTYETDEEGNWTHIKTYDNGALRTHREYGLSSEGWSYLFRQTEYMDDGTKLVCEFDENEAQISEVWYDKDGTVIE